MNEFGKQDPWFPPDLSLCPPKIPDGHRCFYGRLWPLGWTRGTPQSGLPQLALLALLLRRVRKRSTVAPIRSLRRWGDWPIAPQRIRRLTSIRSLYRRGDRTTV